MSNYGADCPESPYRKCSSKVFLNGVQVGFVLMIENNIPFTAEHLAAMSDVSRARYFNSLNAG